MFLCDSHCKFWTFSILLNLKQIIWKNANPFQKNRAQLFSWKIKNATFPYKTALPESIVKTNIMGRSAKWTYQKERSFASNYSIFSKVCFSLTISYKEMIWCTNHPKVHIKTFREHWSFIWGYFFLWVSLRNISKRDFLMQQFHSSLTHFNPMLHFKKKRAIWFVTLFWPQ